MIDTATVERLIRISKEKPLLPETFVPWHENAAPDDLFLPDKLVSLEGHPLWATLDPWQKRELGRLEVVQVMYSYGWSESLACLFFNRHLLTLSPETVEAKFLIRELIEEFRHQEMFTSTVEKLGGQPLPPTRGHRFFGEITVKYLPAPLVFMSVLAIEHMADIYAKHIRKDPHVFNVLRKVSELHHIEEGRHIFYTELWLERFTKNAGFARRTVFSLVILANLYFMRTLYVNKAFFEKIGVPDPQAYFEAAQANFRKKFAINSLDETIKFVKNFNGFNFITRPLWRRVIAAEV